ncbi:uncharacterized protein LOC130628546 [Hydractinia symbiolongicarpus]|uniref:uncharacterized protein LOC130628546 n=1 Tax=Hydractinia symbiolongicarpus TaxID=13093 RepID=UPI00254E8ACA|nr:uncharacterized protein LOC130628546 [Hydractinia symbiolongicarpus]XP_057297471.1 uncharacterized protein LOC130628546 [Hydractinia symbiolongicarpus]
MRILVYKNDNYSPDKLEISSLDAPTVKIFVPVKDIPHLHKTKNIKVVTHGYTDILTFIEDIQNVEELSALVEYISHGGDHRTTCTRAEWYKLCLEYLFPYFSLNDENIRESIQFPPYKKGNKISELAYLLKNALMVTKNVGVITSYNTEEHLTFLKYPSKNNLVNYQKRILIIFPNPIGYFNIRYT